MDKSAKKAFKNQFKSNKKQELLASLPMDIELLKQLLSFLNREDAPNCDHSLKETIQFLTSHDLNKDTITLWLNEHGGFCDCEVIFNVYDDVGDIVGWHLD